MTPPATECDRDVKSLRKASQSKSASIGTPLIPSSRAKARPKGPKLVPHASSPSTFSGPPINTNLSSYDRTDPFSAFNVLLKLLGSLSSRVGALQYRLAPAEHKLSLHLLAIIEPFLGTELSLLLPPCITTNATDGTGPVIRRRTLTRQPTEILDSITSHIDTPRDLLSFSSTCRRIYDVVFPRHIYYRVIRCKISSIKVWHHLSTHKSLARNVRKLEIVDERAVVNGSIRGAMAGNGVRVLIPPDIQGRDTDFEATSSAASHESSEDDHQRAKSRVYAKQERMLIRALGQMSGLEAFVWSCNHSPISVTDLWPTLLKCRDLKSVEVANNLIFKSLEEDNADSTAESSQESGQDDRKALVLPGLESISFRTAPHSYGSSRTPVLNRISNLVSHCPGIKSLDISYTPPRNSTNTLSTRPLADEFLLCNRWSSSLTSLTLTNLRCQTSSIQGGGMNVGMESLAGFLAGHPCLEILNLDIMVSPPPPAATPTPALAAVVAGLGPANPPPAQAPAPPTADHHDAPLLVLPPNSLPYLRELRTSRDMATAILSCPSDTGSERPLEALRGFRLSGALASLSNSALGPVSGVAALRAIRGATRAREADQLFLDTLKRYNKTVKCIEMIGWTEMEDIRRIAECLPSLHSLDVGRKVGGSGTGVNAHNNNGSNSWNGDRETRERDWNRNGNGSGSALPPVTNPMEWANVLTALPELEEVKGIRFFYEVPTSPVHHHQHSNDVSTGSMSSTSTPAGAAPSATTTMPTISHLPSPPSTLSATEQSRMKKNNEVAGMLVWKCPKLRRVDYWQEAVGRVVLLGQDSVHQSGSAVSGSVSTGSGVGDGVAETKQGKVRWGVGRVRL
ncbi:hypothetical protein BDN72DRAFT_838619 [Pluteus cervinus]|uniref:Uncharacterized protein n=1 Tax=Pluteus cervinus TaxID=181527 RepID=A0ACD3B0B0_9AGAR|nr:hypothetical protein BDN72DRAFT_838619 [Pluteus cervinus]